MRLTPVTQRGFTLIEILVVITLIGIMAGAAMLSVGGQQARQLKNEALRLQLLLNQARDESELTQRTLGVIMDERGYQFLQWDMNTQRWSALDTSPYKNHQLASTTTLLTYAAPSDGSQQRPFFDTDKQTAGNGNSQTERRELQPQIIFSASGDHSAFVISLSSEQQQYQLSSDGYAATRLQACHSGSHNLSVAPAPC